MTNIEQILLYMCVGAVMGSALGNIICLIMMGIDNLKEKKRKKKAEAERKAELEALNNN